MPKKTVCISLIGVSLDRAKRDNRWDRWRPTISLCQQEDLLIDRLELIGSPHDTALIEQVTHDIAMVSAETKVCPQTISWDDPWDFEEVYVKLQDFCKTYPFNPDKEDYLVHLTTGTHVAQICWFLLTESRHLPGRIIQTSPSKRKVDDTIGNYTIIDLDLSRYDKLADRFQQEATEGLNFLKSGIATQNAAFNLMIEEIERIAIQSREPILLTGPTGAGKSQLAKRIYALKKARNQIDGAFVTVNCGTLRGDSAISTLFGHVKGAFTGAAGERTGLIKAADKGLLFLDEIGELGLDEQAMLLHAVEDKQFRRLGGDIETSSDFQLIAGTNRDLQKEVAEGRFRADLLARINLWTYQMPGLNERREDIPPNLNYELERFENQNGRKVRFNKEAERRYLAFAADSRSTWDGNFRDLNASVIRMSTLAGGERINEANVQHEMQRLRESWQPNTSSSQNLLEQHFDSTALEAIDLFDRLQLEQVIKVCQQSKSLSDAGRQLYSASRLRKASSNDSDRLKKYLARFDLSWSQITAHSE